MEWSTESIEKVICFIQERPFLFDVSSAELCMNLHKNLMQETCARNLCKFLAQVSWLCVTTITTVHNNKIHVHHSHLVLDGRDNAMVTPVIAVRRRVSWNLCRLQAFVVGQIPGTGQMSLAELFSCSTKPSQHTYTIIIIIIIIIIIERVNVAQITNTISRNTAAKCQK